MSKIRFSLLMLCIFGLFCAYFAESQAQTAIDLHTGRFSQAAPNENPLSKQRIMARDRVLAQQDSIAYNEAVAKAFLLLRQDSLSQTQHELERALRLQPKAKTNAVLRLNLAKIYYWRKQYRDAERGFREVSAAFAQQLAQNGNTSLPTHEGETENLQALLTETRIWHFGTLYDLKEYQAAADSTAKLLQSNAQLSAHDSIYALKLLGDCRSALRDYAAAVKAYQVAYHTEAGRFDVIASLVTALHELKRYDEAVMYLNDMLRYETNDEELLSLRAQTYFLQEAYEAALTDVERLIRLHPKNLHHQMLRAEILWELGHRTKAKAAVKKLLQAGYPRNELPQRLLPLK